MATTTTRTTKRPSVVLAEEGLTEAEIMLRIDAAVKSVKALDPSKPLVLEPKTLPEFVAAVRRSVANIDKAVADATAVIQALLKSRQDKDAARHERQKKEAPREEDKPRAEKEDAAAVQKEEEESPAAARRMDAAERALGRKGCVAYALMKGQSRVAFKASHEARELVATRKAEVDEAEVALQTVEYRRSRLADEVDVVRSFDCPGLREIREAGGVDVDLTSELVVDDAEHAKRVAALQQELRDREDLDKVHREAKALLTKRRGEVAALRAVVASLPAKLDALSRAAAPLHAALASSAPDDGGLSARKRRKLVQEDDAALPPALYALSRQLQAALLNEDDSCAVAVEAAEAVRAEWCGVGLSRAPVAVALRVPGGDRTVKFYAVGGPLDVLTVAVFDDRNERCDADLGHLLADDDDGLQLHIAGPFEPQDFPVAALGRPFRWAQRHGDSPTRAAVVRATLERFRTLRSLAAQIKVLSKPTDPLPLSEDCPAPLRRDLARVASATVLAAFARAPPGWALRPGSTAYVATVQHKRAKRTLKCLVDVPARYPHDPPRLVLNDKGKEHQTHVLSDLQLEVNAHFHELVAGESSKHFLLTHMLARLLVCFDALVASSSAAASDDQRGARAADGGGDNAPAGRHRRGKDRRRPFVFDADANAFTHRPL